MRVVEFIVIKQGTLINTVTKKRKPNIFNNAQAVYSREETQMKGNDQQIQ